MAESEPEPPDFTDIRSFDYFRRNNTFDFAIYTEDEARQRVKTLDPVK
jgi:hypothetical protein